MTRTWFLLPALLAAGLFFTAPSAHAQSIRVSVGLGVRPVPVVVQPNIVVRPVVIAPAITPAVITPAVTPVVVTPVVPVCTQYQVLYRRPHGTDWEVLDLDRAMDMIADRMIEARREGWEWDVDGTRTRRTLGLATLGGATLDNEENYLIKKLFTALGAIQIEN